MPSRELIVHSARTVFHDVGYSAATYQEIASRTDLSRAMVNYLFVRKSDLYQEAIGRPALAVLDAAGQVARRAATLPGQLTAFISAVLEIESADGGGYASAYLIITATRESLRDPVLSVEADIAGAVQAFLDTAVHDAAGRGEFDADTDLSAIVDVLASIVWGVIIYGSCAGATGNLASVIDGIEQLAASWTRTTPSPPPVVSSSMSEDGACGGR